MEEKKLNRSLSPLIVWSIALACIIGWGAFVMPGNLFLDSAGPLGTAIGLSIGAIIMIIISLSYGYRIQRFPVAGGEFAYLDPKTLTPKNSILFMMIILVWSSSLIMDC